MIAADNAPLAFLQKQFPQLEFVKYPGFKPQYSKSNSQILKMIASIPSALKYFRNDHIAMKRIIKNYSIDAIISDNRFGAWRKEIPCAFITHQLHIQIPDFLGWTRPIIDFCNKHYIKHYDECWVPDSQTEPFLSGRLSHPFFKNINTKPIGFLSRFSDCEIVTEEKDIDLLVILSGPEPQRSQLENIILKQTPKFEGKIILLRALPNSLSSIEHSLHNLHVFNHIDDEMFVNFINRAKKIICRAGYSSIMDLIAMKKNALLIPTPGQTEQEYLASYLSKNSNFTFVNQDKLDLSKIETTDYDSSFAFNDNLLEDTLKNWLTNI